MEALIEIFGEVFLTVFFGIVCSLLAGFSNLVDTHTKFRKWLFYCVVIAIFGGCVTLIVLSFIYKTDLYIYLTSGYILALVILYGVKFVAKNNIKSDKTVFISNWILRILHHIFPIVLIVVSLVYYKNKGTPYVVSLSGVALVIFIMADVYMYHRRKISYKVFLKRQKSYRDSFDNDKIVFHFKNLMSLYEKNYDHLERYINEANDEELSKFMDSGEFITMAKKLCSLKFVSFVEGVTLKHFSLDYRDIIKEAYDKVNGELNQL